MMKTTEILMQEHQVILNALKKLEGYLKGDLLSSMDELNFTFDFIKEYSDDYHHGKEEDVYFKWISENHPGLKQGPVACMLKEHDTFRELVGKGKEFLTRYEKSGNSEDREACINCLTEFIDSLWSHINKEDQVLYQMAENLDQKIQSGDQTMMDGFNFVEDKLGHINEKYRSFMN